jgi:1-acyl-sn-glycerol-3-phosphate acyltransferase
MEPWHFDPAADLEPAERERLRALPRVSNLLVCAVRVLAAVVLRCWLRVYHRLTIVGRENLPLDRSFLLVANHASHLDTLCLLAALPLRRLHRAFPLAARDYFCRRTWRALLARLFVNALPFDRQLAPWWSLCACAHLLEQRGNILILFPEGTRGAAAEPEEFKPGAGLLAAGRDVPVVPCHLAGTRTALPKGAWIPRPRAVRLRIGTPRLYAHRPATKESAKEIGRELREAVMLLGQENAEA